MSSSTIFRVLVFVAALLLCLVSLAPFPGEPPPVDIFTVAP